MPGTTSDLFLPLLFFSSETMSEEDGQHPTLRTIATMFEKMIIHIWNIRSCLSTIYDTIDRKPVDRYRLCKALNELISAIDSFTTNIENGMNTLDVFPSKGVEYSDDEEEQSDNDKEEEQSDLEPERIREYLIIEDIHSPDTESRHRNYDITQRNYCAVVERTRKIQNMIGRTPSEIINRIVNTVPDDDIIQRIHNKLDPHITQLLYLFYKMMMHMGCLININNTMLEKAIRRLRQHYPTQFDTYSKLIKDIPEYIRQLTELQPETNGNNYESVLLTSIHIDCDCLRDTPTAINFCLMLILDGYSFNVDMAVSINIMLDFFRSFVEVKRNSVITTHIKSKACCDCENVIADMLHRSTVDHYRIGPNVETSYPN